MGMPEIIINFREAQGSFLYRLGRGIIAYIHISDSASAVEKYTISYKSEAETVLADATDGETLITEVERMFDYGASKVVVAIAATFAALESTLETERFNYLAFVSNTTEDENIIGWCEEQNFRAGRKFMAITDSTTKPTNADLVPYVTSIYPASATKIPYGTPGDIAAIIAGSSDRSATYAELVYNSALTDDQLALYPGYKSETANSKIDAGQLTLVNDGEKIKIGRAVTAYYKKDTGAE